MNVNDIDPVLRFVNIINFDPVQEYCRAADCHFFYMFDDHCPIYVDGTRYEGGRGTLIIVPAGVDYYFEHVEAMRIVSINFDYSQKCAHITKERPPVVSRQFDEESITERPDFEDHPFLNRPIVLENMNYLRPDIDVILEEHTYKKQFYREISSARFKDVLFEVMRAVLWQAKNSDAVNTVLGYIHQNYAKDIDNTELSRLVGYHPYHLNRLIKSATGTTMRRYLIDYRIRIAKQYLQESALRVSSIAELCGYKNFSNFSADFKKKTGISPIKYREALHRMV